MRRAAAPLIGVKLLTACAVAIALLPACNKSEDQTSAPAGAARPAPPLPESPASQPSQDKPETPAPEPAPGAVPFDYPAVGTSAKKGDYVLAPPERWVRDAFRKGAASRSFIYYGGWMLEPGERTSRIKTLTGMTSTIPNAMIIPVPAGGSAKPGDVVLTTWQSGSGMQRAIVVDGGKPDQPKVRYLDLALDNPSGWGKHVDTLKANTFTKLEHPGQVGSTAACKTGTGRTRWIIVNVAGNKLLAIGFAGRIRAFKRSACKDLPIKPKLRAGDTVMVPLVDGYAEGHVEKIDASIGRVWARYSFGGKDEERAFSFTNVAGKLD